MDSLSAGTLLARRYRLIDQIGSGGMSVIWRARDEVLDRIVAVKVLATELSADPQLRRLVREEARAAARLVHPNVAAVHDYGDAYGADGEPTAFVVLELLSGEPLAARLTAGALPWQEAVQIGAQVADALAAAHRLGIVHRDVTPDNVMLTPLGAKVLDFGIATRIGAPDEDEDGGTFGTPTYVAPERLDGVPARPATDVYALGVLLYETLTGQPPYRAHTWEDLARAPIEPVAPAPTGVAGLPPEIVELCQRCLARDPTQRPTAHQVAETLRASACPPPAHLATRTAWLTAAATAAVVVAAALGWVLIPDSGRTGSSPAAVGSAPTTGTATTTTTGTASATPAVSAPAPGQPAEVEPGGAPAVVDAIARVGGLVDAAAAAGAIRPDVVTDLHNLVRQLHTAAQAGQPDVPQRVTALRAKVATRLAEGAIGADAAAALDGELAALQASLA